METKNPGKEELSDLSFFWDLLTAIDFASKYKSAKLFGVNVHPDVDATALAEIDCDDEEVQAMWRYTYAQLRNGATQVPRRRLSELQSAYRWMLEQASPSANNLN